MQTQYLSKSAFDNTFSLKFLPKIGLSKHSPQYSQ
jgi:hypothetical protein